MKKFNATRTIIQVTEIEAENVEEARSLVSMDGRRRITGIQEEIDWRDSSCRFMVFDNLCDHDWLVNVDPAEGSPIKGKITICRKCKEVRGG